MVRDVDAFGKPKNDRESSLDLASVMWVEIVGPRGSGRDPTMETPRASIWWTPRAVCGQR